MDEFAIATGFDLMCGIRAYGSNRADLQASAVELSRQCADLYPRGPIVAVRKDSQRRALRKPGCADLRLPVNGLDKGAKLDKKTPIGRSDGCGRKGCLAALCAVCWAGSSFAAESLFLAGGEASREGEYAYIAALIPFPGNSLGNGFVQRYWAEWLSYEYLGGPFNQVIEASSPGVEAALGYQRAHGTGYVGAYAGVYYRNVSLTPDDPSAEVRGAQTRLRVQLDGEQQFASVWRVNGIASYVVGQDAYWVRARRS
jgi:Cellulose biosynthesis protein BcsS